MKHIIVAAVCAVVLAGCAAIDPIDPGGKDASAFKHFTNTWEKQPTPLCFVIVADKHKGKLAKALSAAVEKYNEAAGKAVAVIGEDAACAKIIPVELSGECFKSDYEEFAYANSCAPAWANIGESIVFAENYLDELRVLLDAEKSMRNTMLHELTHVFGLDHLPIQNRYADCVMAGFIEGQDIDVVYSFPDEFCPAEAEAIRRYHQEAATPIDSRAQQVTANRAAYEKARKGTHTIRYCGLLYTFINFPVVDEYGNEISLGEWEARLENEFALNSENINLNATLHSDECRHIVEHNEENAVRAPDACVPIPDVPGLVLYHRYHSAGETVTMAASAC